MGAELPHVADVADVVALAVFFVVAPRYLPAGGGLDHAEAFEDRGIALAAAAQIVDLARARRRNERLERAHHVEAVNLVAHLLALVAEYRERLAAQGGLDEKAEKAVQLDPAVVGPGETSAAKARCRHAEITAVLLNDQVRGGLRRAEQAVLAPVDAHRLVDALVVR